VAEFISDAQTVHSFYKYMIKLRAMEMQEIERRIFILFLLYIISFVNFSSFQMEQRMVGIFGRMDEYFQRRIWNSRLLNGFCPVSKMVLFSL
jgi:hypothetical protein